MTEDRLTYIEAEGLAYPHAQELIAEVRRLRAEREAASKASEEILLLLREARDHVADMPGCEQCEHITKRIDAAIGEKRD